MYYCCKGLSNCCGKCCSGCANCAESCCKLCSCEFMSKPFGPCVCLNFFLMAIPFLIAVISSIAFWSSDCDAPVQPFLLVQGFLFILNFLFTVYLMVKYSNNDPNDPKAQKFQEKDAGGKFVHLLCYDYIVCLFLFLGVFEVVWNVIGSVWVSEGECEESALEAIAYLSIALMWVFLAGGACLFMCTMLALSCEDGSCSLEHICEDCCFCLFCCCLCQSSAKRNEKAEKRREANQEKPSFVSPVFSFMRTIGIMRKDPVPAEANQEKHPPHYRSPPQQGAQQYPQQVPPQQYPQPAAPQQYPQQYPQQVPPQQYPQPAAPPYISAPPEEEEQGVLEKAKKKGKDFVNKIFK